jgi:hypothetical protein
VFPQPSRFAYFQGFPHIPGGLENR